MKDPITKAFEVANTFAKANPESKELQAKVIPIFLAKSKFDAFYYK